MRRARTPPAPFVSLSASLDTRTGRVALVMGILKGREQCIAARDELNAAVGEPNPVSTDWWTWKTGQSIRIHDSMRVGDAVLYNSCTIDRMDPRFKQRKGVWTDESE